MCAVLAACCLFALGACKKKHKHSYAEEWSTDAAMHWHECSCGAKSDEAGHDFVESAAVAATCTVNGSKTLVCSVCGYEKTEVIAAGHTFDATETNYCTVCKTYFVENSAQLIALAAKDDDFAGKTIALTDSIELTEEWTPMRLGTRTGKTYTGKSFKGTFEGNGKTIAGLTVTTCAGEDDSVGFIGVLDGGVVQNVHFADVYINVSESEMAGACVGLMVNNATVRNVTVASGSVAAKRGNGGIAGRMTVSGTIEGCVNRAAITATGANAGGIAGAAYYTDAGKEMRIADCVNYGNVTNTAGGTGGIVGFSAARVTGCKNVAAITGDGTSVGGIAGEQQNYGSIENCENTGNVQNNSTAYGTGGIVGWVRYSGTAPNYNRIERIDLLNNKNSASVKGGNDVGGIAGCIYNTSIVRGNINTAASLTKNSEGGFWGGIVGNLQAETANKFFGSGTILVENNVSTTSMGDEITGCKDLFAYNNNSEYFTVQNNSDTLPQ